MVENQLNYSIIPYHHMSRRVSLYRLVAGCALVLAWPGLAWANGMVWNDQIAATVTTALAQDTTLAGSSVAADCFGSIVMLTGNVASNSLRDEAEAAAKQAAPGAILVDEINVEPNGGADQTANDATIESSVQDVLARYSTGNPPLVNARARVHSGIVYLLGAISDSNMDSDLQTSIMALPGVHAVVAHLVLLVHPTTPPLPPEPAPAPDIAAATAPAPDVAPAPPPRVRHHHPAPPAKAVTRALAPESTVKPGKEYAVQLGSDSSDAAAQAQWQAVQKANADLLGDLHPTVTTVNLGAGGTRYRLKAGPVADQASAYDLCAKLTDRHVSCLVVATPKSVPAP